MSRASGCIQHYIVTEDRIWNTGFSWSCITNFKKSFTLVQLVKLFFRAIEGFCAIPSRFFAFCIKAGAVSFNIKLETFSLDATVALDGAMPKAPSN